MSDFFEELFGVHATPPPPTEAPAGLEDLLGPVPTSSADAKSESLSFSVPEAGIGMGTEFPMGFGVERTRTPDPEPYAPSSRGLVSGMDSPSGSADPMLPMGAHIGYSQRGSGQRRSSVSLPRAESSPATLMCSPGACYEDGVVEIESPATKELNANISLPAEAPSFDGHYAKYNVCIIGVAPYAVSLARTLSMSGMTVALVYPKLSTDGLHDLFLTGDLPLSFLRKWAVVGGVQRHSAGVDGGIDTGIVFTQLRSEIAQASRSISVLGSIMAGVDVFEGDVRFLGEQTVMVEYPPPPESEAGADSHHTTRSTSFRFHRCVLFPPHKLVYPDIEGIENITVLDRRSFLRLPRLPGSIVIFGATIWSVAIAQYCARLGTRTTLIGSTSLLPEFEHATATMVLNILESDGVKLAIGPSVLSVSMDHGMVKIVLSGAKNVTGEALLIDGPAYPDYSQFHLADGNIEMTDYGISRQKGNRLLTTNRRVFAIDNSIGDDQGVNRVVHHLASQLTFGLTGSTTRKFDSSVLPRILLTDPAVVAVGLDHEDAIHDRREVESLYIDFKHIPIASGGPRSIPLEAPQFLKLLACPKKGTVVGATIVASCAMELTDAVSLAIRNQCTISAFLSSIPHPLSGLFPLQPAAYTWLWTHLGATRQKALEMHYQRSTHPGARFQVVSEGVAAFLSERVISSAEAGVILAENEMGSDTESS